MGTTPLSSSLSVKLVLFPVKLVLFPLLFPLLLLHGAERALNNSALVSKMSPRQQATSADWSENGFARLQSLPRLLHLGSFQCLGAVLVDNWLPLIFGCDGCQIIYKRLGVGTH